MKCLIYGGFFALSAVIGGAAEAERIISVKPGLWEYTHSLEILGLVIPPTESKTECISPEEAERNLSDLLGELSEKAGCAISNLKASLNTIDFDLACRRNIASTLLQSTGHLSFRYGREKITGTADGAVSLNGAELAVEAVGMARHIGRCKN